MRNDHALNEQERTAVIIYLFWVAAETEEQSREEGDIP